MPGIESLGFDGRFTESLFRCDHLAFQVDRDALDQQIAEKQRFKELELERDRIFGQ